MPNSIRSGQYFGQRRTFFFSFTLSPLLKNLAIIVAKKQTIKFSKQTCLYSLLFVPLTISTHLSSSSRSRFSSASLSAFSRISFLLAAIFALYSSSASTFFSSSFFSSPGTGDEAAGGGDTAGELGFSFAGDPSLGDGVLLFCGVDGLFVCAHRMKQH